MTGIGASPGLGSGRIYKYEKEAVSIEKKIINDVELELARLNKSIDESEAQLQAFVMEAHSDDNKEIGEIFEAHLEILRDPELAESVESMIMSEFINSEFAVKQVSDSLVSAFEAVDNEYIRARAADMKDVSERIINNLLGIEKKDLSSIDEPVILMARDLAPSETVQLNNEVVIGFITEIGGRTSHSAIMARTLEIPAVVGIGEAFQEIKADDYVLMNGESGEIIVNPGKDEIERFEHDKEVLEKEKELLKVFADKRSLTAEGKHIDLAVNIGCPEDMATAVEKGAEGVGLFRTEFLYMGKSGFPDEALQYDAYKAVLEAMGEKPVVIRTLDIGGDKELDYFEMPNELNPFLGCRATRFCMQNKEIFRTQLRALIRSSIHGNLHIMLPMIATVDEIRSVKSFITEVEDEMIKEGIDFGDYKLGIMIEIPAAVFSADVLAKEVDFFSIGTNDLIQYTFAADRMNDQVSYLYQPYNPSLLRMIDQVVKAAHKEGKWVGVCGEMGGESLALPLLVGLGLDELSMSASSMLGSRYLLSKIKVSDAQRLVHTAMQCENQEQVVKLTESYIGGL